jgi:hypothetical protein
MKTKSILYWTMTILIASPFGSGGVGQILQFPTDLHGVVPVLGYSSPASIGFPL